MKQYNQIKSQHPDAVLLFRVGDFYETFNEDAIRASRALGITLTKRSNGAAADMDLAGFPHHSLDTYLPKLVRAGYRVAICDQLEDPKLAKKIVKRGVTELVTPGLAFSDKILDQKSNNFLAALYRGAKETGIAFLDASTGEFLTATGSDDYIEKLLDDYQPAELLLPRALLSEFSKRYQGRLHLHTLEDWVYQEEYAREQLQRQFGTTGLKGFGIDHMLAAIIASGAALHYLNQTQQLTMSHIRSVSRIDTGSTVWLDRFTIRNLEILFPSQEGGKTLLDIIDRTYTPMGARKLRRWLIAPLTDPSEINKRLSIVRYFYQSPEMLSEVSSQLRQIGDLERMCSRLALRKILPRELHSLLRTVKALIPLKKMAADSAVEGLEELARGFNLCPDLVRLIERAIADEPPAHYTKPGVIRSGYAPELDELRALSSEGKDYLIGIQTRESERTGITNLKVSYNSVFGYYIEVTNSHQSKVPSEWIRKQTLTNAERYITQELKVYEEKILGAEEKILALEERLYLELLTVLSNSIPLLLENAVRIATLDCLVSFASVSIERKYSEPILNNSSASRITGGRHPVLESLMPPGEKYIENDLFLDSSSQQILMITGPNMSGKSAILRQTALISILAQSGCFVPAQSAELGLVDKIFTRVGASDNLSKGESTFMVEMNETASILHNLSPRSLVLLDEIGRGTSTYDGISIAWAIAEFIHEQAGVKARTLFATHYHELNEMEVLFPRIHNFHISIRETDTQILFLRKLIPGGCEHSFGIHVARMAGMPSAVVDKASAMLKQLESSRKAPAPDSGLLHQAAQSSRMQLSFFQLDDPLMDRVREEIERTDINALTPVEALWKLNEIKKLISN